MVTFYPSKKEFVVKEGTSLYDAAVGAGLPVASSCSAEFICGKCNLTVVSGEEFLTRQSLNEQKLLEREGKPVSDRISCRTYVKGDCGVRASYW